VAIGTNTSLVAENVAQGTEGVGLIAVRSNAPTSTKGISIEERSHGGEDGGGGDVEAECFPEAFRDVCCVGDTISGDITVIGSRVQTSTWTSDVAITGWLICVRAGHIDKLGRRIELVKEGMVRSAWVFWEWNDCRKGLTSVLSDMFGDIGECHNTVKEKGGCEEFGSHAVSCDNGRRVWFGKGRCMGISPCLCTCVMECWVG
jgi:hypothetical protein